MNIAVITGASSGLGQEFAVQMDRMFHKMDEIWLIARRRDRLEELANKLDIKAKVIQLDVTDEIQMKLFEDVLQIANPTIRMLVNCAGFGLMGAFDQLSIQEQLDMVDLNCRALTRMTHLCIPYMRKNSRILQLASSAAFVPQVNFAVYAATKSYVLSFSQALRQELWSRGIYVTAVCPGPVETEFFDIAERYGTTLAVKKLTIVSADRVVREALRDSYLKREKSVCSAWIKAFEVMSKVVPHALILQVMKRLAHSK